MKVIVLAVALALLQTASPTPRQATEKSGQNSQAENSKAASNQTPANNAQPIPDSAQPHVPKPNSEHHASQNEKEPITIKVPPIDVHKDGFDYAYIVAGILIALATLVLALYAVRQANAAKNSADTYKETVRLTERADVLMDSVGILKQEGNPFLADAYVAIRFKNFGRTRASNVLCRVKLTVPDTPPALPEQMPITLLAPGDILGVRFEAFGKWLTKDTMENVLEGLTELRFTSELEYTDIFGVPHKTENGGVYMARDRIFRWEYNRAD
jgi:hypothetical protein